MNASKLFLPSIILFFLLFLRSHAQVVYTEDFESITEIGGVGMYSFGYDKNQDTAPDTYKQLDYGTWYRQAATSIVSDVDQDGDLEIRPNEDTKNNSKMWATLIDPATFAQTGSGVYTLSVELIGADAGNSRIWLASANGYDASGSNDLILATSNGSLDNYVVLSGSGNTQVNELIEYEIPDETVGGTYTVAFNYTAGDAIAVAFGSYNTSYAYDNLSITFTRGVGTYAEDFESITEIGGAGTYSFGYDKNQDTAPNAYKQLDYGTWYRQAATSIVSDVDQDGDLEIRPNEDTKNNGKMWATLIDPATFAQSGSGVYTLSVELIGADAGNARIWLASANGYDASGSNDLILYASGAMSTYTVLSGSGSTVVNEILEYEIPDETVGGTYTVDFNYTAGDALAVAFGSYNTSYAYDNLTIAPYSGTDADGDGLETSVETNTGVFVDANDTGTNPNNSDSDGDGLEDGAEVNTHGTNPTQADTDGDGLSDADEINTHGSSAVLVDTHNDGLSDAFLVSAGLNPATDYSGLLTDAVLNTAGYYSSQAASVLNARMKSVSIASNGSTTTLQLLVEQSSDGVNWSDDTNNPAEVDVTQNGDKEFFRFSLPQD